MLFPIPPGPDHSERDPVCQWAQRRARHARRRDALRGTVLMLVLISAIAVVVAVRLTG
ncbi:MAG: hypothetical protein ACKOPQ_15740 [Novosphingobium sp.]